MLRSITLTGLALLPGLALSPYAAAADTAAAAELEPQIVTGGLLEAVPDTAIATQVITREEIARAQVTELTDLLRLVAGVEIGRSGGPGQQQSIFLRGQDSDGVVVVVDGVRINSALGGAAVQNIRPAMVERIEVIKGAAGAEYGPDAVGGVIRITTRRDVDGVRLRGRAGSDDTLDGGVLLGRRFGQAYLQSSIDHLETDGQPTFTNSDDDRGFRNTNVLTRGGIALGSVQLDAMWLLQRGQTEFTSDGFSLDPRAQDFHNDVVQVSASAPLGPVASQLAFQFAQDDLRQIEDAPDRVRTLRRGVSWDNRLELGRHQLALNGAWTRETLSALFGGGSDFETRLDDSRDYWHLSLSDRVTLGDHSLSATIGFLDDDAFGTHLTWAADYQWRLHPMLDLLAAAGTAVRAPSAFDRTPPFGNPEIDAEEARSIEAGLRLRPVAGLSAEVRAFRIDTTDKIAPGPDFVAQNLDRARNEGIELTTHARLYGFAAIATVVWQDPRDVRADAPLLRRARRTATLRIDRPIGRASLGAELIASSERDDIDAFDFSPTQVPGYAIVNLRAGLAVTERLDLALRVENVADKDYQSNAGFRQPDRSFFGEIRYRLF